MDLYIYYQVECRHASVWQAELIAMQARLRSETGVTTSLKRRPESTDGRHTWMEIYFETPTGFEGLLDHAVTGAGLMSMIVGKRHTEHFLDCSSCA